MICRALRSCLCVSVLLPTVSWAGTIFVNNITGDDRANGLAADVRTANVGPVLTIGRAIEIARRGDAIVIANTGIAYNESVSVDRADLAVSEEFPFVIDGQGATLRGTKRLPPEVWHRVGERTYRYQPRRKGHYQLVVNGEVAQEVAVAAEQESPPELEPLQWCAHRGFVYFRVEPDRWMDQYEIEAPLFDVGLQLHNARHVVVRNLNLERFRLDGVNVSGNSRNVRLENVHSTANGRAGLTVTGTSQVFVGGLELTGNRVAERLVLLKGRVTDLVPR